MSYIILTDDGKLLPFNPADWRFVPSRKDLQAGKYEPKSEVVNIEGDKVTVRITQTSPPLIKIR